MKLAHLIHAHNEPKQLQRLVERLAHPDADIYIHLDKKTAAGPFEHLEKMDNVFFIKNRVKIYWGTDNIVQATLNGFKQIISSGKDYQFVNLLSGQDYPLKSPDDIHEFLSHSQGTAFMNFLRFDPDWKEALPRIEAYHLNNFRIPGRYTWQTLANEFLPKRKIPGKLVPVGRSQGFTIPLECVRYLIGYRESHRKFRRFTKLTWAPDKFIFQTILYNSEHRNKMVNEDLRYIDWSGGGVSPKVLTMDDGEALTTSGALFARKFDINKDADVLDMIDHNNAVAKFSAANYHQ
jgi:hypothetical protein